MGRKAADLAGARFGRLIAVSRAENTKFGKAVWNCICDCGEEHVAAAANLKAGRVKSCGCLQSELMSARQGIDLKGQRFSSLLVLSQAESNKQGRYMWNCICDCGGERVVGGTSLRLGITKSCGCLSYKTVLKDISGQTFGRLTAIEDTGERRHGSTVWRCKCSCGKTKDFIIGALTSGGTKSCGCLQKDSIISGEAHYRYDQNLTDDKRHDRRMYPEYYEWRSNVYARDNYACQKCGKTGLRLNAHHIDGYANNENLRTELSNGITLCADKCHPEIHRLYGHNVGKENLAKFMEDDSKDKKEQECYE